MTYGFNVNDMFRRVAEYVDRILQRVKPGDLPIEHPAKFDMVVNRTTARTLGITLRPTILVQATEIID